MDTSCCVLTAAEYEALILQGLARLGLDPDEARAMADRRFGDEHAAIAEARGRGLELSLEDLAGFLWQRFGSAIEPSEVAWPRHIVDALIAWSVANHRGVPAAPPTLTVETLLDLLRSADPTVRLVAGCLLSTSLGAGLALAGETQEDAEWLIFRELSDLLGRAMSGDSEAVDELAALVTADGAEAFRPEVVREPIHIDPEDLRFIRAKAAELAEVHATPAPLQLLGSLLIEAASTPSRLPRFNMVANTGAPMRLEGFRYPVVLDLQGITIPSQSLPIRMHHEPSQGVGHTDTIGFEGGNLVASGVISRDTAAARDVATSARNGFPWQASVGAIMDASEFVPEGKVGTANGREYPGPVTIARKSTLGEISFVDRGADTNTAATISGKGTTMPPEIATPTAADTIQAERARIAEVLTLTADHPDLQAEAIRDGLTPQDVKAKLFDAARTAGPLAELRASRALPAGAFAVHAGAPTASADMLAASIMIRAGHETAAARAYGEKIADQARRLRCGSLLDVCATAMRLDHRDPIGMDKSELVKAALSTSTLPNILSNVLGRSLEFVYQENTLTWRGFARILSASDFRTQQSIRPSALETLEQVPKGGDIKHSTIGEEDTYSWAVDTFGRTVAIDRRDLVNDSLGFFNEIPMMLGMAAARKLNDLVFTVLMAGAGSFWTSGRANLLTGAGSALSLTSFGSAISSMRKQRDSKDNDIQIKPAVLLVPPELESTANQIIHSELIGFNSATPTGNAWLAAADIAVESRLSNTDKFSEASTTAWFLLAAPMNMPLIVGFLDGRQTPIVDSRGFGTSDDDGELALKFRCYHDFGVALGDFRASVKSDGA